MNEYIAAVVDELHCLGVKEAVLSPGSRSTPLSMWLCEQTNINTYLDIDERSAAFLALGIAKKKNKPVVLVCTSGSAVAHYLPAVIEAKHSRIPLIILSADRPAELRNVGAPQTIDQDRILGQFLNYYEELAIPDENQQFIYPRIVMQKAYLKCSAICAGPVQINVPIKEPLVPELDAKFFVLGRNCHKLQMNLGKMVTPFSQEFFRHKKGIIVCGAKPGKQYPEKMISLGKMLNAPVLADPLSNVRQYDDEVIIDSYDSFLKNENIKAELEPDYILLFGQAPISKRLQQFIALNKNAECLQVDASTEYRNPSLTTTLFIQTEPEDFVERISYQNEDNSYLKRWQFWQKKMRDKLETAWQEKEMFEGKIIQMLQEAMPKESYLVSANSMAIRDIDYFWKADDKKVKILCNRGANGIDGTISTALGVSICGNPTVLLTGDLAFYHDMNGLLVGKNHGLDLVIILINNDGGGIFQYLSQKGKRYFDYLFSTPHGIDFQGVQTLYGVKYHKVSDYTDFQESFSNAIKGQGIHVLEVVTDKERSRELHEKYTTF